MSAPGCWKLSYIFEKNSSNRDSANLSPSTIPYCHDVYGTRDTIFFNSGTFTVELFLLTMVLLGSLVDFHTFLQYQAIQNNNHLAN